MSQNNPRAVGGYPSYPQQGSTAPYMPQMTPQWHGGQMGQMPAATGMPMQGGAGMPIQGIPGTPSGAIIPGMPMQPGQYYGGRVPMEESYIENILRLNLGKVATIYMTFENNTEWNAKIFKGVLEAAGRDHIIISDPQTGRRYLLLMIYLDYITFDEELNYNLPFGTQSSYATPVQRKQEG